VVLRRPASELAAGVQEAVAAGILIGSDPDLAFRHLLIQQALYESMPAALRTALHAEAARELAATGADALSVAQQLSAAKRPGEAWVRKWLIESGPALAIRAPQLGAEILQRELGETPRGDEAWDGLADHRGPTMLVIDDVHELASAEALAQLARLLANLPPQAHAIVSTRRDLRLHLYRLHLYRLRLAGQFAEIRAVDLRFSERETSELLAVSGVALSEAGTALLHQRTEGWAAGVRLAALSLAGHADPELFVTEFSGSDRTVAEYLLAEMLDRQPGEVQDLLLRTCLLDRVNGELADLLTGRPGSERILLDLEDANAFVVSLDPERTWFSYHQLSGDLLRLELGRTMPEQVPVLHRRAAEWFSEHGEVVEAMALDGPVPSGRGFSPARRLPTSGGKISLQHEYRDDVTFGCVSPRHSRF
jgi:hypothetical protein